MFRSFIVVVFCSKLSANINTQTTFSAPHSVEVYPHISHHTLSTSDFLSIHNIITTRIVMFFTTLSRWEKTLKYNRENKIFYSSSQHGNKISGLKTLDFSFVFRASRTVSSTDSTLIALVFFCLSLSLVFVSISNCRIHRRLTTNITEGRECRRKYNTMTRIKCGIIEKNKAKAITIIIIS